MKIKVLLFGALRDVIGVDQLQLDDIADTESLIKELDSRYPSLLAKKFQVAVNLQLQTSFPEKQAGNLQLSDGDTVALLPPFSGG